MTRKLQSAGKLVLLVVWALLWVSPAVAEDEKALYIAGTKVTPENCNNLSSISGVTVAEGGEFRFDFASRTLTMKGVTIKNEKELISHNIENLCINVSGKNKLEATHYIHGIALHFHRSTIMSGDGELNVIASNIGFLLEGHETSLTLSDLTLDVSARSYGIDRGTSRYLIIKNASVRVDSRESAAVYLYKLLLEGSSIVFPVGGWFDDSGSHTIEDSHFKPARVVRIEPEFYPLWIAGTQVRGNFDLAKIAGVRLAQDGYLKYNKKEKTLTMKGVTIDAGEENAIYNEGIDGLTIEVQGTNQLNSKKVATLLLKSHTLMTGNGDFTAISDGGAGVCIDQTTSLTLSNLGFSTSGQWGFVGKDGVSDEKLIVKDAWVKAKGIEGAIGKIASLSAEGGYIAIPENGLFDESKHAVVDAMGNIATDATILGTTYPLRIADIPVTKSNCNDLSSIAGVTVETGGVFKFDPNTKILTMRGVTININEREKPAIYNGIHGLTIDVVGKNQLTADINSFGLHIGASTVIKGEGLLRIVDCNSIYHQATLTIEDLTLDASEGEGIFGFGDIFIKNATVTTRGFYDSRDYWGGGALSGRRITLEDCKIVTPEGVFFSRKKNTILPRGRYEEYYTVKIEPAPSFRTYPLWIGERQVTSDICNDLSVMTGAQIGEGGGISYNPDSKTLTINRVDLAPNNSDYDQGYLLDKYLVENEGVEDLTIDVFGWGYLGKFKFLASTHIKGRGRLRVYGVTEIGRSVTLTLSNAEFDMHWIKGVDGSSDERLVVKGANVYVNGQYTSYIRDIASLTLDGCDFQDANLKFDERVHAVVTQGGDIAERVRIVQTNYPLWIAGRQVTRYNRNYLENFSGVTVAKGGQFSCRVDYSGSVQLDMSGVAIQAGDGQSAISGDLEKITLRGDNRLTSTDKPALQLSETLCIESSSTARLSISSTGNDAIHLLADRALKLEGGELELTGKQGIAWEKESLGNSLRLRKAILKANGTEGAIRNLRKFEEEAHILTPAGGKLEDEKHTIVDAEGNVAKEVVITSKELPLKIAGQQVTVENYNNLSGLSGVSVKEGGVFKYDPGSQTLTMKDVSIRSGKEAIYSIGKGLTIEVAGTNYLSSDEDNALRSEGNIHIKGDGKLTVSSEKYYSVSSNNGFLMLSDLTLDVKGGYSSEYGTLGIWAEDSIVIKNATVTISGKTSTGSLTLEGCQILSPEGARFDKEKRKVVDANGNLVTNLKIGKKEPVTGITVTPSNQTLKVGETLILSATVVPDNATEKGVTWSSSDATIASVSETGEVTALKKGKCTITAQTKEEGSKVKGICEIVVTSQEAPAKFSITLTKEGEGTLAIVGYDDEALKAVAVDTELTVTATPADGYSLTSLIAGTADILTTKKFTVTEAVEVKAVFKKKQNNGGGNQGGGNNGGNNGGGNNGGGSWKPQIPQAVEPVTLASIVVAPNPFTSQLWIENPASLEVHYELVNVAGVVVRSGVLKGTEGVIETEDLPQGVYIARFYGANSAKRSLRVMKKR